jgi:hypothetical protein
VVCAGAADSIETDAMPVLSPDGVTLWVSLADLGRLPPC